MGHELAAPIEWRARQAARRREPARVVAWIVQPLHRPGHDAEPLGDPRRMIAPASEVRRSARGSIRRDPLNERPPYP